MRSQPLSSAASRRRAEEQFKTKKKVDSADTPAQQPEVEKTARLRALRLAKEAADKETANRDAAATAARSAPRRHVSGDLRPHVGQNPSKRSCGAQLQNAQSAYQRASFCLTPSQIAEVKRLHKTGSRRRRRNAALGPNVRPRHPPSSLSRHPIPSLFSRI